MTNIKTQVQGKILTITIDLSEDHGPSKSGKTYIVATTHGFTTIAADGLGAFGLSVNVTTSK